MAVKRWHKWSEVALYIKESRPTVRPKRAAQQRKVDICPRCEDSSFVPDDKNSYGVRVCPQCRGKRSTVA